MVPYTALVVEDDPLLLQLITRIMTEEGNATIEQTTVSGARSAALEQRYDIVILDWMLPDGDGASLCAELREKGVTTPMLMLTARGEVADRVKGLRSGADDYVVKPFDVEELLLRADALVRRSQAGRHLKVGDLSIDRLTQRAKIDERALDLTAKELQLLVALAARQGQLVPRADLLRDVWGLTFDPGSGVLDVHVSRLRDKLGDRAWMVETVRGSGLRLRSKH
ncbi:MAG TPA: response regulator transcription factor [Polyangiaceae bacterium]|nr:response regulator transcription factor [Polyangiaceae bacterium]